MSRPVVDDTRVEDIRFLASSGVGLTEVCKRLDLGAKNVEAILRRADHNDLMRRLRAQDYLPI